MNGNASHRHDARSRRVVIVGGGLAGLSAAESLARLGDRFAVTLLESKRITGGRSGSFEDRARGETIDYCQHVAMGCCTGLLGLLDRCRLNDQLHRYTELQFLHPDHPPSRFAATPLLPPPLHLVGAIGSLRYLDSKQKRRIRSALFRLMRTPSDALVDQTAGRWLEGADQDAETIEQFWDVVLVSALGEKTDAVSMAAARKVFVDGFAASRGASDVLVPKIPLSELFGTRLPAEIASLGVDIRTGVHVRALNPGRQDAAVTVESSGGRFDADHVIVALPWHAVGDLLGQIDVADSAKRIESSPITGVHLWFDRQITDRPHAVLVGTLAQWLFRQPYRETPDATPGDAFADAEHPEAGHYYQVVISASRDHRGTPKETLVGQVTDELRHAFPAAAQARLLSSRVVTDPNSVFSLTPEVERIRPPARTALPWLHLAGDWIATGWPATMEGAVISGKMAAASVAEREGHGGIEIDAGLRPGWLSRWIIA